MTPREFRNLHVWKLTRAAVLKSASHCALCGVELLFDVPPKSKWAPSVDHVVPLSRLPLDTAEGRAAALDRDNLRAVHVGCNGRRGNGTRRVRVESSPARFTSRVW
jgi:5-methylcytosine-specific restriction endonuclease McrA